MKGAPSKDPGVSRRRALMAVGVVALAGAAIGIALGPLGHARPGAEVARAAAAAVPTAADTMTPLPVKLPQVATRAPTPSLAPSTIAYLVPGSASFPTASYGWILGAACDAQQDCETGAARTTDGGATWTMVTSPVGPMNVADDAYDLRIDAASNEDAWVWGTGFNGAGVFEATHDGGDTWQPGGVGGQVVDVAVAGGSAWAVTGCAQGATAACPMTVLSSPVAGGTWSDLAPPPGAVQGEPISSSTIGGRELVVASGSAWLLNGNLPEPTLVTTDDGGRSWAQLPLPCAEYADMSLAASSAEDLMLACVDEGAWPAPQEVWSSADGGVQWVLRSREWSSVLQQPLPDVGTIDNGGAPIGLALVSSATAWMLNDRGDDLVTHDDGATWTPAALPQSAAWSNAGGGEGLSFANAQDGWTFNSAGLWATTDGGADWRYQPIIGPVPGWPASS